MPKEYELRFINFKKNELTSKLKSLGAIQVHQPIIYEYIVFFHPLKKENTYIRVRKEYNNITFTYKTNTNKKFCDEYEVNISNYNTFINILYMLGFKKNYGIQKLREKWKINGCKEIVFDTYPCLPEYMEIECDTEDKLNNLIKKLELKIEQPFHPGIMYENLYGIEKQKKLNDLTFHTAQKIFGKRIKKNKSLFFKILKAQQKYIKSLK
jgi:predicted adenylyl cyclase CyaB